MNSKDLFFSNYRFDLIYKILFLEHIEGTKEEKEYYQNLYLEHIKYFNNFYEDEPRKNSANDFLKSFTEVYNKMKNDGYSDECPIPINAEKQLYDGAHRLSAAFVLNQDVSTIQKEHKDIFDYIFFKKRKMPRELMDIGAYEYVKRNENAYIVNLYPITKKKDVNKIEKVLKKYGFIYYQKSVWLNINGLINIKKINYGKEYWAGDFSNSFAGLKRHATMCCGCKKTRIYVFVAENIDNVLEAKKEIREIVNKGNFPVHINDTREEACELASIYFNKSNLDRINCINFKKKNEIFQGFLNEYKDFINTFHFDKNKLCIAGSMAMGAYGLRVPKDVDVVHTNDIVFDDWKNISSHKSEEKYYHDLFDKLVWDYNNFYEYQGVKILSLKSLLRMKVRRHEFPKDFCDIINIILKKKIIMAYFDLLTFIWYKPKQYLYTILRK